VIFPETEIQYRPGGSFKCFKRPLISIEGGKGPECGAEVLMHGFWWCAQVCPKCLDTAGFYPSETAQRVRETIAANGGQYVPQF